MTLRHSSTPMVYMEEGHGPPVVFVHGAFSDYRVWREQVSVLAGQFNTLTVSLRGYFPTQEEIAGASAQKQADDLVSFLEEIGEPVRLVGHSRGARIALEVAARLPRAVSHLILFEPGGVAEPDFYGSNPPIGQPGVGAAVEQLVVAGKRDAALELYIDHGHGPGAWKGLPAWYREILAANAPTIGMMLTDSSVKLSRAICARIGCPVSLIAGIDSPPVFAKTLDVIEAVNAKARRISIPGNHFANVCETKAFNAALLDCLTS